MRLKKVGFLRLFAKLPEVLPQRSHGANHVNRDHVFWKCSWIVVITCQTGHMRKWVSYLTGHVQVT